MRSSIKKRISASRAEDQIKRQLYEFEGWENEEAEEEEDPYNNHIGDANDRDRKKRHRDSRPKQPTEPPLVFDIASNHKKEESMKRKKRPATPNSTTSGNQFEEDAPTLHTLATPAHKKPRSGHPQYSVGRATDLAVYISQYPDFSPLEPMSIKFCSNEK
ncbi:hypothetical protein ACA910_014015 [Epithemia clementina (nom. ined.)]